VKSRLVVQHQNGIVGGEAKAIVSLKFFAMLRNRKKRRLVGDNLKRPLADPALKIPQELHEAITMQGVGKNRTRMARP
jgi:hypothetical protein